MTRKIILRIFAGTLSVIFFAAGVLLLSPIFDALLNKMNGIVFIALSLFFARYALAGRGKLID